MKVISKNWLFLLTILVFVRLARGFSALNEESHPNEIKKFVRNHLLEMQLLLNEKEANIINKDYRDLPFWQTEPSSCHKCVTAVNFVEYFISLKKSTEEIRKIIEEICIAIENDPPEICVELTNSFVPEMVEILKNTTNTPREVCSIVESLSCGNGDVPKHRWTVPIRSKKPPVKPKIPPKPNTSKLKVLHITDTHFDPLYHIGAKDICDLEICCRLDNGMAEEGESAAGKWGGWKCDIPERTLDNYLEHITKTHEKFDYIVWTGDLPPHNVWSRTPEESMFMMNTTVAKIRQAFPDTPLFPTLGNHEAAPSDLYPAPSLGNSEVISWLYKTAVNNWKSFLPETTFDTILYGGFYIAPVLPGLRLVSLNTNFCYHPNWWLILNSTDPAGMLQWFVNELEKAESEGVKVHVIAHVPPGYSGCLKIWSKNFYAILDRFEETVTAQFYGHTHMDAFEVYYDVETEKRPTGVGLIGPSATTYWYSNPSYRIYTMDGVHNESNYFVDDYETWVMNLTEANLHDNPVWYKLFTAKKAYNLKSLLPEEWNNFYENLKKDKNLMETYFRHYWKDSPRKPELTDSKIKSLLCEIRSCVHYGQPQ